VPAPAEGTDLGGHWKAGAIDRLRGGCDGGAMLSRMLALPLRRPCLTVAVVLAWTVVLGFFALGVRVDSAVENLLPSGNEDRIYYEGVRRDFGSEEANIVAVFAEDVFARTTLAVIDRISKSLAEIDGVREIISLTTMKGVEVSDFGLRVGRLMRALPESDEEAEAFRKKVLDSPLYVGNVVARDSKATSVVVLFDLLSDEEFLARDIEGQIRSRVAAVADGADYAITGIQSLKVRGAAMMNQDLQRFLPVSFALVVLVLAVSFRTVRGVLLPLAAVSFGVVWTIGVMGLTGRDINMGTLVLPPLLMAIGIAYAIHIVSRYYQEVDSDRSKEEMVEAAMLHSRLPVSIASLTTLIGFATLIFNPIVAIRDFGTFAVFGIAAIFLMSIFFVPAALVLLPRPARGSFGVQSRGPVSRLLEGLGNFAIRRRWAVLIGAGLLSLGSLWFISTIRVETDYLSFFSADSPMLEENSRIAAALGGTQPIYVTVDGDKPGAIASLPVLSAIRDLQQFIGEQPGIDTSFSIADYLSLVHSALNPDSRHPLPASDADLQQILVFLNPEDVAPVLTRDMRRANLLVRSQLSGSAAVNDFVRRVEEYARTRFRRGIEVHATGSVVLLNRSADTLARGQVIGLAQILLVLLVLMSLLFLSLRAGLMSLIPNVFPIIMLFGLMGLAGISLNISTSMIAVIAIGIAVDDTIHYLSAFNSELRRTGDQRQAVIFVGQSVGRPIVFTSVALCLGFLVVCLSNFIPIQHFGVLAGATMVIALFADLVLLPALVMTTTIITIWDLLYVKLGPRPHEEIPLFYGLRPVQARIVVLMAKLASADPGTLITRRGELKEELYVLLNGIVDVRRTEGESVIRSLGRGDVIGEMGLVRHRPRSADVVVRETVEYLVLDGGFLDRIQRRYPRIAAKVFLNLTRILSDRLESTTEALQHGTASRR
jgi:hypothetical protein